MQSFISGGHYHAKKLYKQHTVIDIFTIKSLIDSIKLMISWFVNFLMNPIHICFVMLQACTQTVSGHTFHIFDPVTVQVSLDSSNIQHQKLRIQLVEPKVFFYSHSCNSNCGCLCIMAVLLSHHLFSFHIILCYCAVTFKSIVLIILYLSIISTQWILWTS